MRLFVYLLFSTLMSAVPVLAEPSADFHAQRAQLEAALQSHIPEQLDCFARPPDRCQFFLPDVRLDAVGDDQSDRHADEFADRLTELARSAAAAGEAELAFQLLHEASCFGDAQTAGKIVGAQTFQPKAKLATTRHRRLPWKARSYYVVNTGNYQIVTRDRAAGLETAKRSETLHAVWRQLFFRYWCNLSRLQTSLQHHRTLLPKPKTGRFHRVVIFASREEYVEFLRPKHPRIEITLGYYDIATSTSYFFAGDDASPSTQLHEMTHQLFQEVQAVSPRLRLKDNFWVIEGIAMYMESLRRKGFVAQTGGWDANRLQFARYRLFQEDFYVPLAELVALGRDALQLDPRIRQIYSQSAGLTHFFMDADAGRRRDGFMEYLKQIYAGRNELHALAASVGTPLDQLDAEYRSFMQVSDQDIERASIPADSLRSLCLGDTDVTDTGLSRLTQQTKLDWLDLARTKVGDEGLRFLARTKSLRQANLDGARITDDALKLLSQNADLEELDVSNTAVTDKGLMHLAELKSLRTLWLSNTAVSDRSVALLSRLESLQSLAIDGTQISAAARTELRTRLPNLTIQ